MNDCYLSLTSYFSVVLQSSLRTQLIVLIRACEGGVSPSREQRPPWSRVHTVVYGSKIF